MTKKPSQKDVMHFKGSKIIKACLNVNKLMIFLCTTFSEAAGSFEKKDSTS